MQRVIAIVGPTASGKTRLGIEVARAFDGEIVNADSRQVYRFMDIGTAKPTRSEREQARHHLLDVVDPNQPFSLALYVAKAMDAIADIIARSKVPVLVGGTGQYIWALLEGWSVPAVAPDPQFRQALENEASSKGHQALFRRLFDVDPESAHMIDPRNVRRVIRALEVWHRTGIRFSHLRRRSAPLFDSLVIGLTLPRSELYGRIDSRVDKMIADGLVDEVKSLQAMGYSVDLAPMTGIGYMEFSACLAGDIPLESAVEKTKFRTHRLARRQYAWFGPDDPRIRWVVGDQTAFSIAGPLVREFIGA